MQKILCVNSSVGVNKVEMAGCACLQDVFYHLKQFPVSGWFWDTNVINTKNYQTLISMGIVPYYVPEKLNLRLYKFFFFFDRKIAQDTVFL